MLLIITLLFIRDLPALLYVSSLSLTNGCPADGAATANFGEHSQLPACIQIQSSFFTSESNV
jgi:hypothetical protein